MMAGSYKMTPGFAGGDRDGWWSFSKNQKKHPPTILVSINTTTFVILQWPNWFHDDSIYIYTHIIVTINDSEGTSSTQLSWDTLSQVVRMEHQVNFLGFPNLHPKLVGGKAISVVDWTLGLFRFWFLKRLPIWSSLFGLWNYQQLSMNTCKNVQWSWILVVFLSIFSVIVPKASIFDVSIGGRFNATQLLRLVATQPHAADTSLFQQIHWFSESWSFVW